MKLNEMRLQKNDEIAFETNDHYYVGSVYEQNSNRMVLVVFVKDKTFYHNYDGELEMVAIHKSATIHSFRKIESEKDWNMATEHCTMFK